MSTLDFPYRFNERGRTAAAGGADHIRDLIEQVLFTSPGERVMRPDFGAGLLALVFEMNSAVLATTASVLVQSALQQHLSHLIAVSNVIVENIDSTLHVQVEYVVLSETAAQLARFALPGMAGGAP